MPSRVTTTNTATGGAWLAALGCLACVACNFDIPPRNYINVTEIIAVRHTVELGPLHPDRVGPSLPDMHEIPIAEVLPGDRLRLETVVVDVEGVRLADDEIETLWVSCGFRVAEITDATRYDVPCGEPAEAKPDSLGCVLGTGTAAFEFEVPTLPPYFFSDTYTSRLPMCLYGVAAWGGRPVEECWASRLRDNAELDRCGFIYHSVNIGPLWWLLAYADALGLEVADNVELFPPGVFLQPANRIPRAPELTVIVDGVVQTSGRAPLPRIAIEPGAAISIGIEFDAISQQAQIIFTPMQDWAGTFIAGSESIFSRTATTGAIRAVLREPPVLRDNGWLDYEVDPFAAPGVSRVLIGYRDQRWGNDLLTVEFEVQ